MIERGRGHDALLGNAALDVLEQLGFDRREELRRAGAEGVNDE